MAGSTNPQLAGNTGNPPFQLLGRALDELVSVGVLPADRRPGAEFVTWSAVHGLAVLLIDGPLRGVDRAVTDDIEERLMEMVEHGLRNPIARQD
jgi:hypothetical protein